MAQGVFEAVRGSGRRAIAKCPFMSYYASRHPEFSAILEAACRYADDCNIYVRSRRAGERVMASVSRFLTKKLLLKINEAKSAVAQPEERKFLGFSRDMTRRTRGISLAQLIKELKPYLIGWRGYFGFC
ncbi:reverse transcriptase domain-containing protein [Mesorhizobium sp. B3-1-7]|uniref:reverse transcriptase domain-containing protein n=1 Tax=Mesorhizobium sp. B3-1-7 TaxID=2589894 RepID=UPI001FEF48A5|nr:reverse transcriptase domain-containing protein [Mesorhizobium sp. B3-1-7]